MIRMQRLARPLSVSAAMVMSLFLAGCSANFNGTMSGAAPAKQTGSLSGKVMGGQFPLTSARVYLYIAPATGTAYGGAATSAMLSNSGTTNSFDGGDYYVVSDATTGGFNISGDFSCSAGDQVYLLALGGAPGVGANQNQDSALMAALGDCATLNGTRTITINELTTVAGVYALQQFMTDAKHVSAAAADVQGLKNAFTTAQLVVNTANGVPSASTANTVFPTAKIYTLGEVIAHCVNSDPSNSGDHSCGDVFTAANTNVTTGTIGTAPTDTIQALLEIAKNAGANTSAITAQAGTGLVFGANNELATAPNDYALPVAYLGPGLLQASAVAIDADGNAYVNSCGRSCDLASSSVPDVVAKITPAGNLTTFGNPTTHNPQAIMVDSDSLNVWNTNIATDVTSTTAVPAVDIFSRTGTLVAQAVNPASPGTPFLGQPEGIAYDPVNSVAYVADSALGTLQQIRPNGTAGTALSVNGGTSATSLVNPVGVAIDSNGDIVASDADPNGGGYVVFTPGSGTYTGTAYKDLGVNTTAIAFDNAHRLWAVDTSADQVYSIQYTNNAQTTNSFFYNGTAVLRGIAIDGGGQVLIPSCNSSACNNNGGSGDALFVADNSGSLTAANGAGNAAYGVKDASLGNPVGVAVDESGNVWVTSVNPGAVTMFVGLANPVQTPLASAVAASKLGARP